MQRRTNPARRGLFHLTPAARPRLGIALALEGEVAPLGGRVVLVYIAEAHAADEWPINSSTCAGPGNTVRRHTTARERADAARRMASALALEGLPLLCDGMDDAFLDAFAAWPIRLFGVHHGGVLRRIAEPSAATFDLPPFRRWLLECCEGGGGEQ